MKRIKKIILTVIIIVITIVLAYIAINTTLFKPSIGSRISRLIVVYFSKQMFSGKDIVQSMRKTGDSFIPPLPQGTELVKFKLNNMDAAWIRSTNSKDNMKKVILYFHGGGFVMGSYKNSRDLIARISESSGIPVLAIDYCLAPEYKYISIIDDCVTAYKWLLNQGFSPKNIVIGGESAGASLTLMTLITLRDTGIQYPSAVFLLSPVTDFINLDGESYKTRANVDPMLKMEYWNIIIPLFTGNIKTKPTILSPVRQNFTGFPPMLIQVGNDEIILSDSTRLAERAKKCGVDVTIQVWDHMWHVFQQSAGINPEARQAIYDIGTFIKKYL